MNHSDLLNVAEVKVSYSINIPAKERPQIIGSQSAYEIFIKFWDDDLIEFQEEFLIMLLDTANRVKGIFKLSKGGTRQTLVDAKVLFAVVLKTASKSIILAHNHPTQNTRPSENDITITKKLVKAGKLLDISVLDHIIVTKESYLSLADECLF